DLYWFNICLETLQKPFFFFLKGQKRLISIKIPLIYTILTKACRMVLLKDTLPQDLRTKSILF
ncbi:hypothetical protein ACQJ5M_07075, partial [Helicobacter pylori]